METVRARRPGRLTDAEVWQAIEEHRARRHGRMGRTYTIPLKPITVPLPPGTLLGYSIADGITPVRLLVSSRTGHIYLVAKTRMGKTVLIEHICVDDFPRGGGLVLDPHGDLIVSILWRLAQTMPMETLLDRVVILDPTDDDYTFSLNLWETPDGRSPTAWEQALSKPTHIFEQTWGEGGTKTQGWGAHLEDLLGWCNAVLVPQSGTMADCRDLLVNEQRRAELLRNVQDPLARSFWRDEYPAQPREQREFRSSTINKVNAFLRNRLLGPILQHKRSSVRIADLMNSDKLVLVNLSVGRMGWEAATLLGTMLIAEILSAALARQERNAASRNPFMLYIDEVHHLASRDLMELFSGTGKYNVGILATHQYRSQLPRDILHAFLNASNHIYGAVIGPDGQELAWELDNMPPPGDLVPKMRLQGDLEGGFVPVQYEVDLHHSVTAYDLVEGPRRTAHDLAAEHGSGLTGQHPYNFTARLREGVGFGEYRFRSLPSPCVGPMPAEVQAAIEQLRANSRAQYYRRREEIDALVPPAPTEDTRTTRRREEVRDDGSAADARSDRTNGATPVR